MDIKEFAEKYIEAQKAANQKGEFDLMEQLESPDIKIHLVYQDMEGLEAHKEDLIKGIQRCSKREVNWEYVVGDGNVFVLSVKGTLTFSEEVQLPGVSLPAGATLISDGFSVHRIEDGKIAEVWLKGSMTVKNE